MYNSCKALKIELWWFLELGQARKDSDQNESRGLFELISKLWLLRARIAFGLVRLDWCLKNARLRKRPTIASD